MIYLLEDDESIRKLVTYTLQHVGYEAAGLSAPSAFWAAMKRQTPELVLLRYHAAGRRRPFGFEKIARLGALAGSFRS